MLIAAAALTAGLIAPAPGAAAADPAPATDRVDHCGNQCADILPPGANGSATLAEILGHRLFGTKPAHSDDQLGPYDALSSGYAALTGQLPTDESPSAGHGPTGAHAGSAFQYGWWGYADKDLRAVLGRPVKGKLGKAFCGDGKLDACRDTLLATLVQPAAKPAAKPATEVYPGDGTCKAGDQWCSDTIIHRAVGGITPQPIQWQNRPTYQQVVEFPTHR